MCVSQGRLWVWMRDCVHVCFTGEAVGPGERLCPRVFHRGGCGSG